MEGIQTFLGFGRIFCIIDKGPGLEELTGMHVPFDSLSEQSSSTYWNLKQANDSEDSQQGHIECEDCIEKGYESTIEDHIEKNKKYE